jgi:hypothetical protein
MMILPTSIEQAGPGVDLSNVPEGVTVRMSDPGRMKDEGRKRHGCHWEKSLALSRRRARILMCGAPRG